MNQPKVFCVGFQKTGTTSLGKALEVLGYHVCGYWPFRDLANAPADGLSEIVLARATGLIPQFGAFKDSPWPVLYKECDELCPGSKFIHVVRDEESWIRSVVNDFGAYPNSIRQSIYGVAAPLGNESVFLDRYREHNEDVVKYFSDRPEDFISLNLNRGEVNWENVCGFLGVPTLKQEWPHANSRRDKWVRMLLHRIKSKFGGLMPSRDQNRKT